MIKDDLKAISRPKRRLRGSYKDLIKCILARKEAQDGKIVYPGKSLSGSDIRSRLRNRSLVADGKGLNFSAEKGIAEAQGMSKIELMRSIANDKPKIDIMRADLQRKADEAKQKKVEDAIKFRIKSENDGKG